MIKLLAKLKQPYPLRERTWKQTLLHSFAEGFFIYLFLITFQPFGIREWNNPNKYFFLLLHGLVVSVSLIIIRKVLPALFEYFRNETKWNLGKEIVQALVLIILITSGILTVNHFAFGEAISLVQAITSFLSVCLIAIFPIVFWVMADHNHKLKKYKHGLELKPQMPLEKDLVLTLLADNQKDSYQFSASDIIFVEAQENYCQVILDSTGIKPEHLIRSSLANLEKQLPQNIFKRLHRSYIFNVSKIEKVSGNAQGYKVKLYSHTDPLPVGRSYSDILKNL